jgi:hypothetical protein
VIQLLYELSSHLSSIIRCLYEYGQQQRLHSTSLHDNGCTRQSPALHPHPQQPWHLLPPQKHLDSSPRTLPPIGTTQPELNHYPPDKIPADQGFTLSEMAQQRLATPSSHLIPAVAFPCMWRSRVDESPLALTKAPCTQQLACREKEIGFRCGVVTSGVAVRDLWVRGWSQTDLVEGSM